MIKKIHKNILLVGLLITTLLTFAQDKTTIESASFNTQNREYAPVFYNNGLVYCGINIKNEALTYVDKETGEQMTNLFFVTLDSGNTKVKLFSKELQTSYHDGPITFSVDGKTAYFTRSQNVAKKLKNSTKKDNRLGIYKAVFDGEKWGESVACSFNSKEYNTGQPSLSKNGKILYVVSDKPNGFGGKDIYYSIINDGICGELINLGATVNTSSNEMFPYVDIADKLYFSSDRVGGIGGLDIYVASKRDEWIVETIQGTSLNSEYDDFSIVWNNTKTEGYFTSNRNGSDDIFKINITYPEFTNCEELLEEQSCFEFFEEATIDAESVAMIYEWDFGDGEKVQNIEAYHCYKKSGFYIVELNVMDTMIDEKFINEATYELEIVEVNQPKITCPDSIYVNEEFSVKIEQGKWREYTIQNYYINYGDSNVVKNDKSNHKYSKVGEVELQMLITGIDSLTQEIMTNCFYKKIKVIDLQNRVNSDHVIATEIIEKIQKEVLDSSYYELELLTSKTSLKSDTNKFKNYNHSIREKFNNKTELYSYTTGKVKSPIDLISLFREAQQLGFTDSEVKEYAKENNVNIEDLGLIKIDEEGNTNVILKNVSFAHNKYNLNAKAQKELEKLISFLKNNKDLRIEVGAHSDNVGNNSYNLNLSQKRANSVMNYMVKKGVKVGRLTAKGYGELKPIATNETGKGRAENRRVAFKILVTPK